jgi:hypothetical protein
LQITSGPEKCCLKLFKEQIELPENGRFIAKSSYVLNTTTLYGRIFEQRDKISVREEEVGDEKSTS